MSEAILVEKRKKHKLERAWRHSKLQYFHHYLCRQVHNFNHIVSQAKSDWYTRLIDKNKNKPQNLWQGINRILHRSQSSPLPNFSDCTSLSNRFGTYFQDKTSKITSITNYSRISTFSTRVSTTFFEDCKSFWLHVFFNVFLFDLQMEFGGNY